MDQILGYYQGLCDFFWSENVWLPPNTTWDDLDPANVENNIRHTDYRDLKYPILLALVALLIRYIAERYWFAPIGRFVGIVDRSIQKTIQNQLLEKAYVKIGYRDPHQIFVLGKKLEMTDREIARWLNTRRHQQRHSTLEKFCENAFRCHYYTFSFIFGLCVLWNKSWLWDITQCFHGYPHQGYTTDIWYYYMIQMAYCWSVCYSQFTDIPRQDFWQMFTHHIATILLMCFSWICNLHRIGTLVLFVHDAADILLQLCKMLKYMRWQRSCDTVLGLFAIVWIITRLGIFPFWIIRATLLEAPGIISIFPGYFIFNTLLLLLLGLHIYWTWLILKILHESFKAGQMDGDIRSAEEDSDDD